MKRLSMLADRGYPVRPIKVTIDVDPQKIPDMVCCDYSLHPNDGTEQIAVAVAKALGLEDYLYQPERIYELRRWMWEQGNNVSFSSLVDDSIVAMEATAD